MVEDVDGNRFLDCNAGIAVVATGHCHPAVVAATTEYGARFVSAVAYDNVFACQFHPEKSQRAGIALLERFLAS